MVPPGWSGGYAEAAAAVLDESLLPEPDEDESDDDDGEDFDDDGEDFESDVEVDALSLSPFVDDVEVDAPDRLSLR
jgi:hypothetical protein